MSLATMIYLADVSGSLSCLMGIFVFAMALITFWAAVYSLLEMGSHWDANKMPREVFWGKAWKRTLLPLVIFSVIGVVVPSRQAIYLMASARVATDIAQTKEAKEIGDKILKVINVKLDEMGGKK